MEMKDEILAGIQQNMRIESVRGEAQPDAPYGPGPKAALEDALELGRKLGFKVGQADNRIGWVESDHGGCVRKTGDRHRHTLYPSGEPHGTGKRHQGTEKSRDGTVEDHSTGRGE